MEKDPRVYFAAERTFLAWIRTALALVAGGVAVLQLAPTFAFTGARELIGMTVTALGGVLAEARRDARFIGLPGLIGRFA